MAEAEANNAMGDLERAWEAAEEAESVSAESAAEPAPEPEPEPQEKEDGEHAENKTDAEADSATGSAGDGGEPELGSSGKDDDKAGEGVSGKADSEGPNPPISWKASVREHWKDLPKEVKDEITRREQNINTGMQKNSEAAQYGHAFNQVMQPFQHFVQASGMNTLQAVQNVMQTATGLQGGAPQHKVQIVHDLIRQYGVDIGALDQMLTGGQVNEKGEVVPDPNLQVQAQIQEAMAPINQFLQGQQQNLQSQQYEAQQTANTNVDTFAADPKNEFYEDVKLDMADLLDLASKHGRPLTIPQAYTRACAANPDISTVMEGRTAAQTIARKKVAASSVTGSPSGVAAAPEADTLRGALEMAWGDSGRV